LGDFNPNINPDVEPATVENFNPTIVEVDEDSVKDFNPNIEGEE
jgi:hypothetical protein